MLREDTLARVIKIINEIIGTVNDENKLIPQLGMCIQRYIGTYVCFLTCVDKFEQFIFVADCTNVCFIYVKLFIKRKFTQ